MWVSISSKPLVKHIKNVPHLEFCFISHCFFAHLLYTNNAHTVYVFNYSTMYIFTILLLNYASFPLHYLGGTCICTWLRCYVSVGILDVLSTSFELLRVLYATCRCRPVWTNPFPHRSSRSKPWRATPSTWCCGTTKSASATFSRRFVLLGAQICLCFRRIALAESQIASLRHVTRTL